MDQEFLTAWSGFLEEVQKASEGLLSDVHSATTDMEAMTREVESRLAASEDWKLAAHRTDSLRAIYLTRAPVLLGEVIERYRRQKLDERGVRAFAQFDARLEDAVGRLPVRASLSPKALIDTIENLTGMPWWVELVRLRDRERTVLVRAAAMDGLSAVRFQQSSLEGGIYLFEAQASLGLLDPWQLVHGSSLEQLRGEVEVSVAARFDKAVAAWQTEIGKRQKRGEDLVARLGNDLALVPGRLTGAVVGGPKPAAHRRQLGRRREYQSFWSRQRAAVRALMDAEAAIVTLGEHSIRITAEAVGEVRREAEVIAGELDAALSLLDSWQPGQPDPLLHANARLVSRSDRKRRWRNRIERSCGQVLEERIESLEPRQSVPGLRKPWRMLEPRRMFLDATESVGEMVEEGFLPVEMGYTKILRGIDRAREVVSYSLGETWAAGAEQIASEGVANARSLLDHQRQTGEDPTPRVEAALVDAVASSFYQFLLAFERGRFSLVSHLAREGARRAGRQGLVLLAERLRQARRFAWSVSYGAYRRSLIRIGWVVPSSDLRQPVEAWSYFGDPAAEAGRAELPLIYDHLFRPEPVEERRFLVGRDEEIQALEEARDFWKAGRFAAVMVDGERGSGKTSLLNCAVAGPFRDETVVRVSITERLLTARAVHEFLARALDVDVEGVLTALRESRRVMIIEEAERTYLRRVDGMEAIRELLSIVAGTTGPNLWVLSLTSEGFRFLDRALSLSTGFSHLLHASAVTAAELQDAILQRHNLSGLRLEFTAPPGRGRIVEWLKMQTARAERPDEAFFADLHETSGGVFRSAFTTWRRHIDRVDGGVLHVRYLDSPDHSRLTRALSRDDLFLLQMLLQHGSLTPEENSMIFECPVRTSYTRIEHLIGRGILEPEPVAPGYRARPEAGILIRAALNARNLL